MITTNDILLIVARIWDISVADIIKQTRTAGVLKPRAMAVRLILKHKTCNSLSEVARAVGYKSHASALHAGKQTHESFMFSDKRYAYNYDKAVDLLDYMLQIDSVSIYGE